LLRTRDKWQSDSTTEKRDELAPFHAALPNQKGNRNELD
jgi:hypothetical protein